MKLSSAIIMAVGVSSAAAFAPTFRPRKVAFYPTKFFMADESAGDIVTESAMPSADPYDRIGVSTEQLALGIDATEFLQWIGTKSELIEKFQRDNKGMSEENAEKEVSKFLMDAEMVNAYIKFEKNKVENPPDYKAEAEQTLSDPKTIATYAAWLVGGASFGWIRNTFIEPKFESGEWEPLRVTLPTPPWVQPEEAAEAAASVASLGHMATEAINNNMDAVTNSLS